MFLVRHGDTEWATIGRHTGRSEVSLTVTGEQKMRAIADAMVGDDRFIAPRKLAQM